MNMATLFGVRWQSEAATPLWISNPMTPSVASRQRESQSGVAATALQKSAKSSGYRDNPSRNQYRKP